MLDLFERDEMVRSCEDCLNEFVESRKACRGCGRPLQRCVRSEYERILVERPLRPVTGLLPLVKGVARCRLTQRLERGQLVGFSLLDELPQLRQPLLVLLARGA